ncbi:hypothetical protein LCGC14_0566870 [marine sediment metagenome]|uniref:Uncharacterized protein n=1 Tax=marine sediment metagenome TaxID=412755 RepID=A0A0F9RK82_9ZZZZ
MVDHIHREGCPYFINYGVRWSSAAEDMGEDLRNGMRIMSEPFIVLPQEYGISFEPIPLISRRQAYGYYSKHLDIKYPHVCFKCKTNLTFKELFDANRKNGLECINYFRDFDMPLYRKLKRLWKSEYVQFYCCECLPEFKV